MIRLCYFDLMNIDNVTPETNRKRYCLAELLEGVTLEGIQDLLSETAWAFEGTAIGRELI